MGNSRIEGRFKGKGILFVGFQDETLAEIAEAISLEGGKLIFTGNGSQALDRISQAKDSGKDIHLIIMDYPLLEISKVEMLTEMLIRDINIPLLVIFEQGENKYLENFSSKFSSGHILKPFTIEQFINRVADFVL
ncbi:MAG TPA: hypothetical protein VMX35_07880 [Acidobacteriota bacterium]|nr:hypothetical protein [Acidobacteriota bacterium]